MKSKKSFYPFDAHQTVNLLSEFGPLITMFIVNGLYGINAGTWSLIFTTALSICLMYYVFKRPPIFPLIASTVTVLFGSLTIITGDPKWVQIKVTLFNLAFALFLFFGLWIGRNFFQYVFGKSFHYSKEGWDKFTRAFACFFIVTAVLNEVVRLTFDDNQMYEMLGIELSGINVWIAFKLVLIMPLSALFAWALIKWMSKHHKNVHRIDSETSIISVSHVKSDPLRKR
ncbi:MAG: inner membrane-spanning protein YciB [Hyphomicrobium sp.]